jgi:hypothetical protein
MITAQCIISRNQGITYKNPLLTEPHSELAQEGVDSAKRRGIVGFFTALLFVPTPARELRT